MLFRAPRGIPDPFPSPSAALKMSGAARACCVSPQGFLSIYTFCYPI